MLVERSRHSAGGTLAAAKHALLDGGPANLAGGTHHGYARHGARNFPLGKERSDLDIELTDGCTDTTYLTALNSALSQLKTRFNTNFSLYLAGADPHENDRLGRLKLTAEGLQLRDQKVFAWLLKYRIPSVMVMAGGYGLDVEETVTLQLNSYRAALTHYAKWKYMKTLQA